MKGKFITCLGLLISAFCSGRPAIADLLELKTSDLMPANYPPVMTWRQSDAREKGTVIIVHGLSQRAESVEILAKMIAQNGFEVLAIDQRGHGGWHQAQRKGEDGFFCDFNATSKDLSALVEAIKKKKGNLPIFLIGESIGASVALKAASIEQSKVDGVIACSCAARATRFKTSWVLLDCASVLMHPRSEISVKKYQQAYACENPAALQKSLKDTEARTGFRAREIVRINRFFAHNKTYVKKLSPQTDLLILSGDLDKLTVPGQCKKLLSLARSQRKELITINGSGHMMIGRPDSFSQTLSSVAGWLNDETERLVAHNNNQAQ